MEKLKGMKNEYKSYYERASNGFPNYSEISMLKQKLNEIQLEMATKHSKEMEELRMKLLAFNFGDEKENLELLKRDLQNLNRPSSRTPENNPLFINLFSKQNIFETSAEKKKKKEQSLVKQKSPMKNTQKPRDHRFNSLEEEREFLINELYYEPDDPLIVEIEKKIRMKNH